MASYWISLDLSLLVSILDEWICENLNSLHSFQSRFRWLPKLTCLFISSMKICVDVYWRKQEDSSKQITWLQIIINYMVNHTNKRLNRLINLKLSNAQENHNVILSIFNMWIFTICNYIDMIIICLLRELLVTINFSFFEKQETIIVPLVGASQMCYRKNLKCRKIKKHAISFKLHLFLFCQEQEKDF